MIRRFDHLPEETVGNAFTDKIWIPNVPFFAAGASMKTASSFTLMGFQAGLDMITGGSEMPLFIEKTVDEVIWGYDDKLSAMASVILPPEEVKAPGKFGLFAGQNLTSDGMMTVNTGQTDITQLGEVLRFRNKTHFNAWKTRECNRVQGGEGGFFPPGISEDRTLEVFVSAMCRSLKMTFDDYVQAAGMTAMRFRPDPDLFNYDAPENECYCVEGPPLEMPDTSDDDVFNDDPFFDFGSTDTEPDVAPSSSTKECHGKGVFEIGPCKFGAPLLLSWPHFLDADDFPFMRYIEGMHPDVDKHGMVMDVQQDMGIALSGNIRLQMNVKIEKITGLKEYEKLPMEVGQELVLPLMWMDDEIKMSADHPLPLLLATALKTGDEMAVANGLLSGQSLLLQLLVVVCYLKWKTMLDDAEDLEHSSEMDGF